MDENVILHLEKLARLQLDPTERAEMQTALAAMLTMINRLQEVDVTGVQPLVYMNGSDRNELRSDVVQTPLSRNIALANAPKTHDNTFFAVPQIMPPQ